MSDTPKIYVRCLASYNAGHLHGAWIDATDADCIMEEIQEVLESSPERGEEWAIHDHEGFHGLGLSEYEPIERVAELGRLIAEHGAAFAAYANQVGVDYATEESFQGAYCGEWDSERAYAENLFDELYSGEIPDHLQCYISYGSYANDLFMGDCFSVDKSGGVYVFHNH